MTKRFPKEIFIKIESDPNDKSLSWFIADDRMEGHVTMGNTERIAVYKLVELRDATGIVSHRKVTSPTRKR